MSDKESLEAMAVVETMRTVQGRNFVNLMLERCGTYNSVLKARPGFTASESALVQSGWQDFGHFLMSLLLKHCPEMYHQMVMEQVKARYTTEVKEGENGG